METTEVKGITYTYNKYEISETINKTIDKIEKIIKDNNYVVNGDINQYKNLGDKMVCLNLSKNQMKKIQKYCYWIDRKPSLKKINSFFSLLSRLFQLEKVYVKISIEEQEIQKARKEWIKARNEAERLLINYKTIKGDFYKQK